MRQYIVVEMIQFINDNPLKAAWKQSEWGRNWALCFLLRIHFQQLNCHPPEGSTSSSEHQQAGDRAFSTLAFGTNSECDILPLPLKAYVLFIIGFCKSSPSLNCFRAIHKAPASIGQVRRKDQISTRFKRSRVNIKPYVCTSGVWCRQRQRVKSQGLSGPAPTDSLTAAHEPTLCPRACTLRLAVLTS